MKIAAIQMISGTDLQRTLDADGQWLAPPPQGAGLVMGEVPGDPPQDARRLLPALNHRVL